VAEVAVIAWARGTVLVARYSPLVSVRRSTSIVTVWFRNFLSICIREGNDFLPITDVPYGNNFETR
jgi:hypothetical protein